MEIKAITLGDMGTNCYLVSGESGAVVIDPAVNSAEVTEFLKKNENKERLILITHAHFDHIGGAKTLSEETDTKIGIGEFDNDGLSNPNKNLSQLFGVDLTHFSADILFKDGEKFSVGDLEFEVIYTSGHTEGGVCYLLNDNLFSGDTLFYESIGRTDFPTGDLRKLINSVHKLFELDGKIKVFSGHGPSTDIDHEKQFNPYIR